MVKNPVVPVSVAKKIVHDLIDYKKKSSLSDWALSRELGVSLGTMQTWISGKYLPRPKGLQKIIDAKMSAMQLPESVRQKAIAQTLSTIDDANKIPRKYRKRIAIPDIISNQLKLLIDDYISGLEKPKTYSEFNVTRDDFINKMYYTCQQGE